MTGGLESLGDGDVERLVEIIRSMEESDFDFSTGSSDTDSGTSEGSGGDGFSTYALLHVVLHQPDACFLTALIQVDTKI